jgi:D-alanine transaminase/branched-chain amino acid aminotransferase
VSGQHAFFLDDHLDRFFHSAKVMKLEVPYAREEIKTFLSTLIEKNALPESGVKMILTGGYSQDGYAPGRPNLLMTQSALKLPSDDQVRTGVNVITFPYVREFAEAKTINYNMGIWLLDHIKKEGASDVLYHHDEIVSEFPRCNIFIIRQDNTIVTPARAILKGVTRKNVLKLATKGYTILEEDITRQALYSAKEVFMTSTTKRILPVVVIDGKIVNDGKPGPVTLALLSELLRAEKEDMRK